VEDELPSRGGGVDAFLQGPEADLSLVEAGEGVDEVP
jgi:hypothetical protein